MTRETITTLHGTTFAVSATATDRSPRDLGALLAFHAWRDFMRGYSQRALFRPEDCDRYFTSDAGKRVARVAYRRHFNNRAFQESAR